MIKTLPKSDVIKSGDKLQVESDFEMKVVYQVPKQAVSFYMECFPRKPSPKKLIPNFF